MDMLNALNVFIPLNEMNFPIIPQRSTFVPVISNISLTDYRKYNNR